ncbi:acylphosphatase [Brevibacterium pityocampae]
MEVMTNAEQTPDQAENRAARVVVTGEVQGVSYRESCRRAAESRGVAGWVRNTETGTVEALFVGSGAAVDAMIDWCRTGPPAAEVAGVHVEPSDESAPEAGFTVR